MSYTFLLEQGEESSAECFSDIPASVLSRSNRIAKNSSSSGNEMELFQDSQFGTTFGLLTARHGEDESMLSVADSLVRTLALQGREEGSKEREVDYGPKWPELFAKWDRDSFSWKTAQLSLLEGLDGFSEIWPKSGMMRNGECLELMPWDIHIEEPEFGFLPTPSGVNGGRNNTMGRIDEWGGSSNPLRGTVIGYLRLPEFEEMVMGWPIGWTALTPFAMGKFQRWLRQLGGYSVREFEKL